MKPCQFYLLVLSLTLAFFLVWHDKKPKQKKTPQQLPRSSRRSKLCAWAWNVIVIYWVVKHLHCLFVMINERTSVDNRLKTEPFLMRRWIGTNRSLEERCTTEYIYVQNFYRSSRDLAFPDKILRGVRGVKWQLKNLGIFLGKLSLDLGISFCCLSVLSFEEVYFRHRNMFI